MNSKVIGLVLMLSLSLTACGNKIKEEQANEIKSKALESLKATPSTVVKTNSLELNYKIGEDEHKIIEYSRYKEHEGKVYIQKDINVKLNDDETEAHSVDYVLDGKRYRKFVKGADSELADMDYTIYKDESEPSDLIDNGFSLIADKIEIKKVDEKSIAGEKLYHVNGEVPLNVCGIVADVNMNTLGAIDEDMENVLCSIDIYLDEEDYSLAQVDMDLTKVLNKSVIEKNKADVKLDDLKFSSVMDYSDTFSIIPLGL